MKTKMEAIERIKHIQRGELSESKFPDSMKGSAARQFWHDPKFSLGTDYGQIEALLWAFDITPEDLKATNTQPTTSLNEQVDELCFLLRRELRLALAKHPLSFHSPHEGYAVIKEELDELWEHVRKDTGCGTEARKEAMQVAAMGLRYVMDLCRDQNTK